MVNVKQTVETTFKFSNKDIQEILDQWIKVNHNVDVKPTSIKFQMTGGYEDRGYYTEPSFDGATAKITSDTGEI